MPAACGVGVDCAAGAVATARRNAERLGLAGRADFRIGDWAEGLVSQFDVVVTNPPYIAGADIPSLPREVRDFDPRRALDGGADGLDAYRAIAAGLSGLLAQGGMFAGEIGYGGQAPVVALLTAAGLIVEAVVADLAGIPRCVVARRLG